jgi:hypothetical protein
MRPGSQPTEFETKLIENWNIWRGVLRSHESYPNFPVTISSLEIGIGR